MLFKEYYKVGDDMPNWLNDKIGKGEAYSSENLEKKEISVSVITMERSIACYSYRDDYILLTNDGWLVPCHKIMFNVLEESGLIGGKS